MKKILLFIFLIIPFLLAGQTNKNIERSINITALQAGSDHFKNGNPGNESNFGIFAGLARKAAASQPKPDLICFPEYAITGWGYPSEKIMNGTAEKIPGEGYWYKRYEDLARETATPILGWLVESSGGKLYNTSFMLDGKGNYLGKYRKVQANLGEQTWWGWSQGEEFSLMELDGVKYGISICADMWYPETVRCEELLGADVILHVSIADDMGHLIPARAFDSKLPIIVSVFQGGAYAVDHEGKMLGKLSPEEPGFITFTIHPFIKHLGKKYGGVWDTKKGSLNVRNVGAYLILTDPSTRPAWTEIFMDNNGNPQTKEQLLKRFNGRYDAKDPEAALKILSPHGPFEKWKRIEIEFSGPVSESKGNPNPFDIPVDVAFTGPSGRKYTMPAFYDGDGKGGPDGSVWKVRFSADETGAWNFKTVSSNQKLNGITGDFTVNPVSKDSPDFYRWGRLETAASPTNNIRYLKFREGPYWMKAGCDDPENILGNLTSFNTNAKRQDAVDYLADRGINSLYIMTHTLEGDGKDVWPWLGRDEKEAMANGGQSSRFDITRLEEWRELFEYMQSAGMVVYIVLEDDSGWKGYDHARYYREMVARFSYLPGIIFNLNEEHNENYTKKEALEMMALLEETDPFDHPRGIHNINKPDDEYIKASQVDFTSIQTGTAGGKVAPDPDGYHELVTSWINRCRDLSSRTLMVSFDEGRPEEDRRMWWSTYMSGGVWEAHVLGPYDRPMSAWDTIWTGLGGARTFMESIPFWEMSPDQSVIESGKAFCLGKAGEVYALYLPEGGRLKLNLPGNHRYIVEWWDPANGRDGQFRDSKIIRGGSRNLNPPDPGDWAVRIKTTGEAPSGVLNVPLYETFETWIKFPEVKGNRFTKFASFIFTKKDRSFKVDGFYDGDDTWRVRFMPDETGTWKYTWEFEGKKGKGQFTCTPGTNQDNHGHVKRDKDNPRYLEYDDGTPHYWYGGKWINGTNYGPPSKNGEINPRYLDDKIFLSYLDTARHYRHNGLLLKTALYPVENDLLSWDLEWIRRGEWLVREMAARGIYCQLNFFDTWSREKGKWFTNNTDGKNQVFNVWDSSDETTKENYLRTLIARYSGFYNVYWELGNEMEHRPNSGTAFAELANDKYLPWIRKYDPYGLPVCLSEEIWRKTNADIGLIHQTDRFPDYKTDGNRPNMINELVRGGIRGVLATDSVIRNPVERISYRRTFWRYFTYGGCGSTEATWLSITEPLNEAVLNVMGDQMRLRNFIDQLPVSINEMDTDTGFVATGPGSYRTRGKKGECYVSYFLLEPGKSLKRDTVTINAPAGLYELKWYDPASGTYITSEKKEIKASPHSILHPDFTEDIVLLVTRVK